VIFDNPLPASTGRVCQHSCDNRCRRLVQDEAVNMREVHRLIAESILLTDAFDEMAGRILARRLPASGRKAAVVGAGPAGLTAAFYLALLGHAVTVFEAHAEPGGMLRYALPEYRLPKSALDREIEIIRRLAAKLVCNTRVGESLSLNDLDAGFDAVFLSIGAWKESWLYLSGTEFKGVRPALPFLEGVAMGEAMPLGDHVAVIGAGNAAIDSARTAVRRGAAATVIYRRERKDMPAIEEEVDAAEQEGVRFLFLAAPHRIVGEHGEVKGIEVVKTRLGDFDPSGRHRPILTDEVRIIRCSAVILAVGETLDLDFCKASGLRLKESGSLDVNRYTLETSREKFYAGGDLVTGASNISNAMGYGKEAARHIDARFSGRSRFDDVLPQFVYDQRPPDPVPCRRHHGHDVPAALRRRTFSEAMDALTPEEALREAARCLRCDIRENGGHAAVHV